MKSPDHGTITSMADLRAEMQRVKDRVGDHEQELGQRWKKMPGEVLKSFTGGLVGRIVPLFIGGEMGAGAFKLVKGLFELIKTKKKGEDADGKWKSDLTGGAAKLGLFTGLKLLMSLWKGK